MAPSRTLSDPCLRSSPIQWQEVHHDAELQALENIENTPPRIVNPRTKETFVLLHVHEYERLKEDDDDDSPWTREELHALAWEAGKHVGWQDSGEYDNAQEKP